MRLTRSSARTGKLGLSVSTLPRSDGVQRSFAPARQPPASAVAASSVVILRNNSPLNTTSASSGDDNGTEANMASSMSGSDDEQVPKLASKKRKRKSSVSRAEPRRKKGKFAFILNEMPLEVISQICSDLLPGDLLHLVRSSKVFALFLLNPSQNRVWISARLQMDNPPPACPSAITERAYANLLFGNTCQKCGSSGCGPKSVSWFNFRRWCEKCKDLIMLGKDEQWVGKGGIKDVYSYLSSESRRGASERDSFATRAEIKDFQSRHAGEPYWKVSDLIRTQNEERNQAVQKIREWTKARAAARASTLNGKRLERVEDLKDRLEAHGFSRVLLDYFDANFYRRRFPTMKQAKRMDEKAWAKIRSEAISIIEQGIASTIEMATTGVVGNLEHHYEAFVSGKFLQSTYTPTWHAIQWHPRVKGIVDKWIVIPENAVLYAQLLYKWHTREEEKTMPTPFELIEPVLVQIIPSIQQCLHEDFLQALRSSDVGKKIFKSDALLEDLLERATTRFTLRINDGSRTQRLAHFSAEQYEDRLPLRDGAMRLPREPGTVIPQVSLEYDVSGAVILSKILQLCNLSTTATHEYLNAIAPGVVCLMCGPKKNETMAGRLAPQHWEDVHGNMAASRSKWRLLSPVEKESFLAEHKHDYVTRGFECCYDCALCDAHKSNSKADLVDHLSKIHNISPQDVSITAHARRMELLTYCVSTSWKPSSGPA